MTTSILDLKIMSRSAIMAPAISGECLRQFGAQRSQFG